MDLYEAIMNRRSHRMYKPDIPPKADDTPTSLIPYNDHVDKH